MLSFLEREIKDDLVEFIGLSLDLKDTNSVRLFGHLLKE